MKKSKIFIIDFNGEYCSSNIFGLENTDRKIIQINTRNPVDKIDIKSNYLFDADILSILFDARPATQVPFLKKSVSKFLKIKTENEFSSLEIGLLISILRLIKGNNSLDALDNWIGAALNVGIDKGLLNKLSEFSSNFSYGNQKLKNSEGEVILEDTQLTDEGEKYLKIDEIEK